MVELLATFLDHDYNEDADQIIAFLEKEGMLPPPIKVDPAIDGRIVYCYYPCVVEKTIGYDDFIDFENSQLWEPEDEEK